MAEEFHGLFQFTEGDTNVKENDGGVDEDDDFLYTFERRKRHQIDRSWVPIDTVDQWFTRCLNNKDDGQESWNFAKDKQLPQHILNSIEYLYMKRQYAEAWFLCCKFQQSLNHSVKFSTNRELADIGARCLLKMSSNSSASQCQEYIEKLKSFNSSMAVVARLAFQTHQYSLGFLSISDYLSLLKGKCCLGWRLVVEGCDRLLTDATFSDLHNNINILKKAALECELLVVAKAASSTDGQLRSLLENHHIDRAKIELDLLNNNIVLSSIRDALASLTSRGIILEPHASIIAGFIDNRLQAQQEEEEDEKLIISE